MVDKTQRTGHSLRSVAPPPLNLVRLESNALPISSPPPRHKHNEVQRTTSNTTTVHSRTISDIIEASHTILFTSNSLQRSIDRCIGYTGNDSLHAAFSSTLDKSKSATDKLILLLKKPSSAHTDTNYCHELVQTAISCISILKDLCHSLRTRLSTLVQSMDPRFSRNLLMNLYTAAVDIKITWEVLSPYVSSADRMNALALVTGMTTPTTATRNRSLSELTMGAVAPNSPYLSPLEFPGGAAANNNHQLYTLIRSAVTVALRLLTTLRHTIDETLCSDIASSLEKKLLELKRKAQNATELSHILDENVQVNMASHKEAELALPANSSQRKEMSEKIWQDTSIYLKAIVSVMTFVRSVSTEEDFVWPKSIKQDCLGVTRMTADVAKLWNHYSTFAEDGFYLGKHERSHSISEQQQPSNVTCSSPQQVTAHDNNNSNSNIPIQRSNTFYISENK